MNNLDEYLVFYMVIEPFVPFDIMQSIGISPEPIQEEMFKHTNIANALQPMFKDDHNQLCRVQEYAKGVQNQAITMQQFGPAFIAYFRNENAYSVKSLYALVAIFLPRILRKMGNQGRLVRGAFVKGYGWEIKEGTCRTLYGPIMYKAWDYLTKRAYSPRIMIEPALYEYVSNVDNYDTKGDGEWITQYVREDFDGQPIFDYLVHASGVKNGDEDTDEVIINEIRRSLSVVVQSFNELALRDIERDFSSIIRTRIALREYILESLMKWAGTTRKYELDLAESKRVLGIR